GDLQVELGDLDGARKAYDEALAIRREIGEEMQAPRDAIALGLLDLLEDKPAEAERLAREALPFLDRHKLRDDAASARAVIARARVVQGKTAAAEAVLAEATQDIEKSESFLAAMDVALARGVVVAAGGAAKAEVARHILDEAAARAASHGYLGYAYEIRL